MLSYNIYLQNVNENLQKLTKSLKLTLPSAPGFNSCKNGNNFYFNAQRTLFQVLISVAQHH